MLGDEPGCNYVHPSARVDYSGARAWFTGARSVTNLGNGSLPIATYGNDDAASLGVFTTKASSAVRWTIRSAADPYVYAAHHLAGAAVEPSGTLAFERASFALTIGVFALGPSVVCLGLARRQHKRLGRAEAVEAKTETNRKVRSRLLGLVETAGAEAGAQAATGAGQLADADHEKEVEDAKADAQAHADDASAPPRLVSAAAAASQSAGEVLLRAAMLVLGGAATVFKVLVTMQVFLNAYEFMLPYNDTLAQILDVLPPLPGLRWAVWAFSFRLSFPYPFATACLSPVVLWNSSVVIVAFGLLQAIVQSDLALFLSVTLPMVALRRLGPQAGVKTGVAVRQVGKVAAGIVLYANQVLALLFVSHLRDVTELLRAQVREQSTTLVPSAPACGPVDYAVSVVVQAPLSILLPMFMYPAFALDLRGRTFRQRLQATLGGWRPTRAHTLELMRVAVSGVLGLATALVSLSVGVWTHAMRKLFDVQERADAFGMAHGGGAGVEDVLILSARSASIFVLAIPSGALVAKFIENASPGVLPLRSVSVATNHATRVARTLVNLATVLATFSLVVNPSTRTVYVLMALVVLTILVDGVAMFVAGFAGWKAGRGAKKEAPEVNDEESSAVPEKVTETGAESAPPTPSAEAAVPLLDNEEPSVAANEGASMVASASTLLAEQSEATAVAPEEAAPAVSTAGAKKEAAVSEAADDVAKRNDQAAAAEQRRKEEEAEAEQKRKEEEAERKRKEEEAAAADKEAASEKKRIDDVAPRPAPMEIVLEVGGEGSDAEDAGGIDLDLLL